MNFSVVIQIGLDMFGYHNPSIVLRQCNTRKFHISCKLINCLRNENFKLFERGLKCELSVHFLTHELIFRPPQLLAITLHTSQLLMTGAVGLVQKDSLLAIIWNIFSFFIFIRQQQKQTLYKIIHVLLMQICMRQSMYKVVHFSDLSDHLKALISTHCIQRFSFPLTHSAVNFNIKN